MKKILCFTLLVFQIACAEETTYAPVVDGNIERVPKSGQHRVAAKETLYSIAWRYGLDHRKLARMNHLAYPYHLSHGTTLALKTVGSQPSLSNEGPFINEMIAPTKLHWVMPARGRLTGTYSDLNKGIDIAGQVGDPIFTAAPGRVVYAGNGLKNYGNLIIIDHDGNFLTAYAHNEALLVQEGDIVLPNQQIATMGNLDHSHPLLHFEVRLNGKPVNPLRYLSLRS